MTPTWSQLVTAAVATDRAAVVSPTGMLDRSTTCSRSPAVCAIGSRPECDPAPAVPALLSRHRAGDGASARRGAEARRPIAPLGPRLTVPELAACVRGLDARRHRRRAGATPNWVRRSPGPAERATRGRSRSAAARCARRATGRSRTPRPGCCTRRARPVLPKPVPYRQGAVAARTRVYTRACPSAPGDVFVAAGGFHHIAGSGNLAVALAAGATIAQFPVLQRRCLAGARAAGRDRTRCWCPR